MKYQKWLAAGLSAGLLLSLLSGCGSEASAQSTVSPSPSAEATQPAVTAPGMEGERASGEKQSGAVQGIVTAIDGDTITMQIMGRGAGGRNGGLDAGDRNGAGLVQETPQQDAASSQIPDAAADQTAGATPEGQGDQAPEGGMPQGQPGDSQSAPAGEEITITLSSDTKITVMDNGTASEGTAEDIVVGCMIQITYGEDGQTVTEITVSSAAVEAPKEEQQQK